MRLRALQRAVLEKAREQGLQDRQVAQNAGVKPYQVYRIRHLGKVRGAWSRQPPADWAFVEKLEQWAGIKPPEGAATVAASHTG